MKTVLPAWMLFVATGVMISLIVPLGEGFDEPWHFSYIQYIAQTGRLPAGPSMRVSAEVEAFLLVHPIGWRLKDIFTNLHSQEDYWHSPDRLRIDASLRNLRFAGTYRDGKSGFTKQYESHQAPLYYLLSAPLFFVCSHWLSFVNTFLILRVWSVLLASAVIPLSFALARRVTTSETVVRMVPILAAVFPGLYPDVVRVSNDALAVPLAAMIFVVLARYLEFRLGADLLKLSGLLLLGLLTKAFFLPIVVAIVIACVWFRDYRATLILVTASVAGCAWYAQNLWITGSWTGLPETVSANTTVVSSLSTLLRIDWFGVLRLAAVSHIWIGNWSLLQYRSWMYETVLVMFAIGLFGFITFLLKSAPRGLLVFSLTYVCYAAALVYYATQVYQQTGIAVIQGWYLSTMLPVEVLAFVFGLQSLVSRWIFIRAGSFAASCLLALTVYGNVFIAAPYYTNLIEHTSTGHVRAYHPRLSDASLIAARLTRFYPWMPDAVPLVIAGIVVVLGLWIIWSYLKTADYAT